MCQQLPVQNWTWPEILNHAHLRIWGPEDLRIVLSLGIFTAILMDPYSIHIHFPRWPIARFHFLLRHRLLLYSNGAPFSWTLQDVIIQSLRRICVFTFSPGCGFVVFREFQSSYNSLTVNEYCSGYINIDIHKQNYTCATTTHREATHLGFTNVK